MRMRRRRMRVQRRMCMRRRMENVPRKSEAAALMRSYTCAQGSNMHSHLTARQPAYLT